MQQSY